MENGTSLDDILNNEPTEEVAQEPETIGQPRDEHGKFAAKERPGENLEKLDVSDNQPTDSGPPPQEPEASHIPMAALKDERTKRQQIEAERQQLAERLQQYETYFQQLQAQNGQEEDQDPIELVAQQVMARLQPQNEMQMLTVKVELAEQLARQKWEDYDEKVEHFKEAVKANPFLLQELRNSANPAEYAYNAANRILEAKSYGSAPSREQQDAETEARLREKIMAEIGVKRPQAPTSLATERSVGSRSGPAWTGPTSLDDLLG